MSRLPQPASQVEAIAGMFSVIRNAAQPFRIPDPGKPDASQTIWQVVLDLTNRRYVYESTTRPNIVWVDLADLDFTEGSPPPAGTRWRARGRRRHPGSVSGHFETMEPVTFLP